jgi:hypothetical protein
VNDGLGSRPFAPVADSPVAPLRFKSAAAFCAEYVPLSYVVEGLVRSSSLYSMTAKTAAGKTAFNVVAALAVATGRADILGREVTAGRVAYLACENPDDIRMRFKIAAFVLDIDLNRLGDRIVILDRRAKPEDVLAEVKVLAADSPFAVIFIDTLAAFFDGDNINDPVQGGGFMRRLRPLTQVAGLPAVVVSAHPVKNAGEEALIPYGSGAILNEVDGNLTLWKTPETGIVSLHWQGKLRGLEFQAPQFRFQMDGSPDVVDIKGREVRLPTLRPIAAVAAQEREQQAVKTDTRLLCAMRDKPAASQKEWAAAIERTGSLVNKRLKALRREKLVETALGKWTLTAKGRAALENL